MDEEGDRVPPPHAVSEGCVEDQSPAGGDVSAREGATAEAVGSGDAAALGGVSALVWRRACMQGHTGVTDSIAAYNRQGAIPRTEGNPPDRATTRACAAASSAGCTAAKQGRAPRSTNSFVGSMTMSA
jgi:hypothetical protein